MRQRKTKLIAVPAFLLALSFVFSLIPLYAAPLSAVDMLLSEQPKAILEMEDFDDVLSYYEAADTDTILDENESNYAHGTVRVEGEDRLCHVYMRTFVIRTVWRYTVAEANEAVQTLFQNIKTVLSAKYIKCVAVHYAIAASGKRNTALNRYETLTIRFFICTNESNEERQAVIDEYVKPTVAEWMRLPENDRLIRLNEFMLDGKFRYDMSYKSRSSVAQFIRDGEGLCEEYAALLSLFLDALGYKNMLICGEAKGIPHVWNLVDIRGKWYNWDVLWNGPIDENGNHITVELDYLLVSGKKILENHTAEPYFEEIVRSAEYDYYFGEVPYDIDLKGFTKSGNFIIALPETNCKDLLSHTEQARFIEIYRDGVRLADNEMIGTGTRVVLQVNGVEIRSYYILTAGDLTGDGIVGRADLERLEDHFLEISSIESAVALTAADLNGDGDLTVTDLFLLYRLIKQTRPGDFPDTSLEPGTPSEEMPDTDRQSGNGIEAADAAGTPI